METAQHVSTYGEDSNAPIPTQWFSTSCFTEEGTTTAYAIWSKPCLLFLTVSKTMVSHLRHSLYSLKKGHLTLKEDLAKTKGTCDILSVFGHDVPDKEQVSVILSSLSVKFDSILTFSSYASESLPLDRLTSMFLECESQ